MILLNKAFETYINSYTSQKTRDRSIDSIVKELIITDTEINAKVKGSKIYQVSIQYTIDKVRSSKCNCAFEMGPVCKHIVNVLKSADIELADSYQLENELFESIEIIDGEEIRVESHPTDFIFKKFNFSDLTNTFILKNSLEFANDGKRGFFDLQVLSLKINQGTFKDSYEFYQALPVSVKFINGDLILSCSCRTPKRKMCEHQVQLMYNLKDRKEFQLFFDEKWRNEFLYTKAFDYGLENEPFLENYFQIEYVGREVEVTPINKEILAINSKTTENLKKNLLPIQAEISVSKFRNKDAKLIMVFGQHRYYDHIFIELLDAKLSKDGQIKNPLTLENPLDYVWKSNSNEELKF